MTSTESEKLGQFALDLTLDAIPGDVLTLAKEHFLDALGIALASSRFDFGDAILNGAGALGDGTQATAIGSGVRLPAPSAALVNGVLAHGLDFDDTHIGAVYHATSPALAAALAAGEANGSSGAEVLIAFTSALEIGCRLATVGAGAFHDRAFHPTSLCGTFAAAAVAGRLAKVDHETMTWALGLCGSQASGILERGTSWLKRLHPGWAAHCGLSAMALARAGFTGPTPCSKAAAASMPRTSSASRPVTICRRTISAAPGRRAASRSSPIRAATSSMASSTRHSSCVASSTSPMSSASTAR